MVVGEPPAPPARAPIDGDDEAVHGLRRLELEPALAAASRLVHAAKVLRHRALVPGGERTGQELAGRRRRGHERALGEMATSGDAGQRLPATRVGLVDERTPGGHEAVEKVQRERHLADEPVHLVDAAESSHQLLEG